jgi:hypothetical protein
MVVGLQRFRDHFRAHSGAFVLIGGAACDARMTANTLTFRRTKDLDIVLVADAVDTAFADRFKAFVDEGGYEVRQRQGTGKREFFRFYKPKGDDYPFILELFWRAPAGLDVWPGQQVVPVPVEESVAGHGHRVGFDLHPGRRGVRNLSKVPLLDGTRDLDGPRVRDGQ